MRSVLAEIIARVSDNPTRLLLAVLPAPLIGAGALLIHIKTDIAYRLLQAETAIRAIFYVRLVLFAACVIAIVIAFFWLRRHKPALGRKTFALLLLIPLAAIFCYFKWVPTLLICLFVGSLSVLTQLPLWLDVSSAFRKNRSILRLAIYMQAVVATGIVIFGIMLWVFARDSTLSNARWIEIKKKGLYGEFNDIRALAENPRIEFARITDPNLEYGRTYTQRIGSGDDAYTVSYAMIGNKHQAYLDPAVWPLWYECASTVCSETQPLFVNVDMCPNPKDCHEDFAPLVYGALAVSHYDDKAASLPPTLRLLTRNTDLRMSKKEWQANIRFAAKALLYAQLFYLLLHAVIVSLNRLLKKSTGR